MRAFFLCLCISLATFVTTLNAQFEYGEVLGTVRDSSGGVVAHAKITLRNLGTNVESSVLSNDQGNYSFPDLRAGNYQVSAVQQGFRPAQSAPLGLRVGDRLRMDISLETGQVSEQVTVLAEAAPLLET